MSQFIKFADTQWKELSISIDTKKKRLLTRIFLQLQPLRTFIMTLASEKDWPQIVQAAQMCHHWRQKKKSPRV